MSAGSKVLEKQKKVARKAPPKKDPLKAFTRAYELTSSQIGMLWQLTETAQVAGKQSGLMIDTIAEIRAKLRPAIQDIQKLVS